MNSKRSEIIERLLDGFSSCQNAITHDKLAQVFLDSEELETLTKALQILQILDTVKKPQHIANKVQTILLSDIK